MTIADYPFAYIHDACGKPAFYLSIKPELGDALKSSDAMLLSGERPQPHSPIECGSCGELLPAFPSSANVHARVE